MSYRPLRSSSLTRALALCGLLFASLLLATAPALGQQTAARPDRGSVTGAAYAVSDVENINLNNGNLGLSIPLASLPPMAGGKLSWTVSATYNSKLWDVTREQKDYTPDQQWQPYTVDTPQLSALGGWSVGGAYQVVIRNAREDVAYKIPPSNALPPQEYELIANRQWFKVLLRTPDGAERELRPVGPWPYNGTAADFLRGYYDFQPSASNPVRYSSFDGTFLSAVVKSFTDWTLFMPDGTQVVQTPDGIQRVRDTNGNSIKIFGDANGVHYQDERTGREIRVAYDPAANGGQGQVQVWYQTAGGGWAMVAVNMGTTQVQGKIYGVTDWHPTGGELGEGVTCTRDELLTPVDTPINIPVVREIVFPQTQPDGDAPRFSFGYNGDATETFTTNMFRPACGMPFETFTATASIGWGALNHMVTPLGADVSYSYSLDSNHSAGQLSADATAEERVVRKVVRHDGEEDEWRYDEGGVINPDGTVVWHSAFGHGAGYPNFGVGAAGLVFRTVSPGVTVERHWTSLAFSGASTDSPGGAVTYNPVVDAEYTTLLEPPSPGATPVPVRMSAKTFKHDYNGNVTEVKEYDWFSPTLVTRGALGIPTGVPAGATLLRTTPTGYHNSPGADASSALVYAKRPVTAGSPSIINAVRETAAGPAVTRMSYDGQEYGAAPIKGNMTQVSRLDDRGDADAANDAWVSTSSTYDTYGNVSTATDALGRVTEFFYDDAIKALPTRVAVDPLNGTGQQVTSTVYDPSTGLVTSTTDPNDATSEVSYVNQLTGAVDPFGRPGVATAPPVTVGGVAKRRKSFTFYEDSLRRVRTETDLSDEGDRLLKSRETRDELGRVVLAEQNEGGTNFTISSQTVYLQKGLVVLKSHPKRTGGASSVDGWTRVTNDVRGRVVEAATFESAGQPDPVALGPNWKGSVKTQYYANLTTATDQAGKSRRSVTDALGRLVRVDEPNASNTLDDAGGNPVQPTSYAYDSLGNLRRVDQGGQLRYFMYDSLGRLIRAKNPEQGNLTPDPEDLPPDQKHFPALSDPVTGNDQWSLAYKYDAGGNLVRRKDARDSTTVYTYDALNRSKTINYLNTGVGVDVERFYDGATKGKGRLWTTWSGGPPATATQHTAVDAYDELGQPLTQRQLFKKADGEWQTYSVSRTYGLAGSVLTQTYPSGRTVNYTYDGAGRLGGFAGNLGGGAERTYSAATLYDAAGRMRQEQFGTQTPLYNKHFYNVAGQLAEIRVGTYHATDSGWWNRGAILNVYSAQVGWTESGPDNNGNLRKQMIFVPHGEDPNAAGYTQMTQFYEYDSLNRLDTAREVKDGIEQWRQDYDYDRWGNRTVNAGATTNAPEIQFEQDAANPSYREVAAPSNRLYAPGDGGRMPGQKLMGYDAAGNLTFDAYTGGGTRAYDAEGRMVAAQVSQTQTALYTYDADGRRVRRNIGAGTGEVWQVYGMDGELLAEYAAQDSHLTPQKEYGYRAGELLITAAAGAAGWGAPPVLHDNPLVAGLTIVQSRHVTELRDAINALRAHMGMSVYSWQTAASSGDWITAAPILEMRAALDGALGAPSGGYGAGLEQGQPIKAVHIQELRERVLGAWQAGSSGVDVQWLVTDQLGTPRMVVDETGSLSGVKRHDYLPFGEEIGVNVGGRTTERGYGQPDGNRKKWAQLERDVETGLDYAQARYYSPIQGRFTSVDPLDPVLGRQGASDKEAAEKQFKGYLSRPQRWNRYTYCLNNPLRHVDPDGFDPLTVNINIIFDKGSYTEEEKKKFRDTYVAQLQQDFAHIDIQFNVSYNDGTASNTADHNKHEMTSGVVAGALNVFVTPGSVGPSPEHAIYSKGEVWVNTSGNANPGNLTHGVIHALGIAGGVNGYDSPANRSSNRYYLILSEIGTRITGNSAESATQAMQDHLRKLSTGGYTQILPHTGGMVGPLRSFEKETRILREGARKYMRK